MHQACEKAGVQMTFCHQRRFGAQFVKARELALGGAIGTVHRLEGFYWVARTGGYAKAARAFPYGITQPAVHQQVRKLEQELGVALFERVGKDRMQLTAAGRELDSFMAYEDSFQGGVRVALGDVNGDGFPDLVTGAGPGGGPAVTRLTLRRGWALPTGPWAVPPAAPPGSRRRPRPPRRRAPGPA